MKSQTTLKKDRYRTARGGKAVFYDLFCTSCSNFIATYQKDGIGHLKRLYLNRIFRPIELASMQNDQNIRLPKDMKPLICTKCLTMIGTPMQYDDKRLAFKLIGGRLKKKARSRDLAFF